MKVRITLDNGDFVETTHETDEKLSEALYKYSEIFRCLQSDAAVKHLAAQVERSRIRESLSTSKV